MTAGPEAQRLGDGWRGHADAGGRRRSLIRRSRARSAALPLKDVLARWDAIAVYWDLDEAERCGLLGSIEGGPVARVDSYDSARVERRMRLVLELDDELRRIFGKEVRAVNWLRARNRHLGGASPIELMSLSTAWMSFLVDHVELVS